MQPLWALLAEEEFMRDALVIPAQRIRRRSLEITLAEDRRLEEEETRARRERRWRTQAAIRQSRGQLNHTAHRSYQHADAASGSRRSALEACLQRRSQEQRDE